MKEFVSLVLCLVLVFSFTACGNNNTNDNSNNSVSSSAGSSKTSNESTENKSTTNINTDSQINTQSVYVIKNFFAVEGAVIYDQTYDEYGYPNCCYFHKKCETCGDISNNNGSTRGNLTTSYYCPKCKTTNHVEIKADGDWVEVMG